jgi:formate dehydrogenase iron-sulfur subunit
MVDAHALRSFMDALGSVLIQTTALATGIKLFTEVLIFSHLTSSKLTFLKKTALLMTGKLKKFTVRRFMCGVAGGLVIPFLLAVSYKDMPDWMIIMALLSMTAALLAGELLERYLFFRAVVPLRMPAGNAPRG